jgi:hypothetical protein
MLLSPSVWRWVTFSTRCFTIARNLPAWRQIAITRLASFLVGSRLATGSGLVGADHRGRSKGFHCRQVYKWAVEKITLVMFVSTHYAVAQSA